MDVAGWHLYLRDMNAAPGLKMSQALAQQLGPQVQGSRGGVRESDVASLLKTIPVKLGAGRLQVGRGRGRGCGGVRACWLAGAGAGRRWGRAPAAAPAAAGAAAKPPPCRLLPRAPHHASTARTPRTGAARLQVSLLEVMPSICVGDLVRLLEDYSRK